MNLFSNFKDEETAPLGHPSMEDGDPSQCPHLRMMGGKEATKKQKVKKNLQKEDSDSDSSSDEEEKPRGGCPVMNKNQAKDPKLEIFKPGYK